MAKVLLVEDDESIQKMYAFGLTQAGFEVVTASNGGEALARLEAQTFDVILLDMMLTGMSGLDILRTYDVRVKSPQTKVVALTNMDNPTIAEKARELGVEDYLTKANYDPAKLVAYINQLAAQANPAPGS